MDNEGPVLDSELRARDKANPETSHLWGPWTEMYLKDRRSLPINYNPLLVWNDHPNPKLNNQKSRAAMYCWATAKYYLTLADGHLPPEVFNMKDPPSDNIARLTKLLPKMRVSIASKGIDNQSIRYLPYAANGSFPLDMTQVGLQFDVTVFLPLSLQLQSILYSNIPFEPSTGFQVQSQEISNTRRRLWRYNTV